MWLAALCSKQNATKLLNNFICLMYFFPHVQTYVYVFCRLETFVHSNSEAENNTFLLIFACCFVSFLVFGMPIAFLQPAQCFRSCSVLRSLRSLWTYLGEFLFGKSGAGSTYFLVNNA